MRKTPRARRSSSRKSRRIPKARNPPIIVGILRGTLHQRAHGPPRSELLIQTRKRRRVLIHRRLKRDPTLVKLGGTTSQRCHRSRSSVEFGAIRNPTACGTERNLQCLCCQSSVPNDGVLPVVRITLGRPKTRGARITNGQHRVGPSQSRQLALDGNRVPLTLIRGRIWHHATVHAEEALIVRNPFSGIRVLILQPELECAPVTLSHQIHGHLKEAPQCAERGGGSRNVA